MKRKGWFVVAGVAAVALWMTRGGCVGGGRAPDEELAHHLDEVCAIARANIESPERGVRKLGRYLGAHLGDMTGTIGGTIAMIERIPDDDAHDRRARVARDRIHRAARACEPHWTQFFEAVAGDPAAVELLERAEERLGRTLEIIFSSRGRRLELRDLPRALASGGR